MTTDKPEVSHSMENNDRNIDTIITIELLTLRYIRRISKKRQKNILIETKTTTTMGGERNNESTTATGGGNSNLPLLAFVFASSGAGINLFQQQLYYAGAGDGNLLILIVPTFLGMAIGGLSSAATRKEVFFKAPQPGKFSTSELPKRMKQFLAVSITDVTSLTLRSWSQNLCGSGMFTVIYASLPAFNGILTYFFLGRVLNPKQWMSMIVVMIGLAFSAEAEQDSVEGDSKALAHVVSGIIFGVAGTFFSSASYICAERVLKGPDAPQHPTTLTAINGINDLAITMPWLLFYSIPHRKDLLYEPVAEKGENPYFLIFIWVCLVASNAAHLNACYMLLRITESVTLTMLQGVRAVMVFAISGLLFCRPTNPEQCLTTQKTLCSFVVLAGVIMYAKSTVGLSKHMGNNKVSTSTTPTSATDNDDDDMTTPMLSSSSNRTTPKVSNKSFEPSPISNNSNISGASSTQRKFAAATTGAKRRGVKSSPSFDSTDSFISGDDRSGSIDSHDHISDNNNHGEKINIV